MNDNIIKGIIIGVMLIIAGSMAGRSSPITASSKVYINSHNSSVPNKKKLDINTATLQEFKDLKCGIGEKKFEKIKDNRPFKKIEELREKKILGYYTYNKVKNLVKVGE